MTNYTETVGAHVHRMIPDAQMLLENLQLYEKTGNMFHLLSAESRLNKLTDALKKADNIILAGQEMTFDSLVP